MVPPIKRVCCLFRINDLPVARINTHHHGTVAFEKAVIGYISLMAFVFRFLNWGVCHRESSGFVR